MSTAVIERVSAEVGVNALQAEAVKKLLDDGCTVPFIARYRKEAHGNLDEVKIGKIQERLAYYTELEERNYKPKRRTRAQVAREKGFEPLADSIWVGSPDPAADDEALQYARDILAERIADIADVRGAVRQAYAKKGVVRSEVVQPRPAEPTKFEQYYDFSEPVATIPSHRYLAIRRGQAEKVLWVHIELEAEPVVARIMEILSAHTPACARPGPARDQVETAARDAFKRLLAPSCEIDVMVEKKLSADRLSALIDVAKSYRTYSGLADGTDGTVKFIWRTEGIGE